MDSAPQTFRQRQTSRLPSLAPPEAPAPPELERATVLLAIAAKRFGRIPPERIVDHVLRTHDSDWPVQRAALEALWRRWSSARRDALRVSKRPEEGLTIGPYETRGARARPYETWLESTLPLAGSCDCPDFTRSSLGLCKHLLVVLDDLASKPRQWALAERSRTSRPSRALRLVWDPVRPLVGAGDWLDRVKAIAPDAAALGSVRRYFRRTQRDRGFELRDAQAGSPRKRLTLVSALVKLDRRRPGSAPPVVPSALRSLLEAERRLLEQRLDGRAVLRHSRTARGSTKLDLYPYQREGVERFLERGRLLLADDMGLGKTAQAIAACHALFRSQRVRRGLLIVPAPLKAQWEREWRRFSDAPVEVIEGPPDDRRRAYRRMSRGFLIANYEQTFRDLSWMKAWKPELVVLDEAQRIKNWATKTAEAVKQLTPPYRLVLTGTPMENRLEELASIMDWVDDHALEPKWRLVPWHTLHEDGARGLRGARNLDTLRERLASSMLRRVRTEVLDQLPPRTDSVVPVPLTPSQQDEHDALLGPIARLLSVTGKRPLTQQEFLRLMGLLTTQRIIANGLAQLRFPQLWTGLKEREQIDQTLLDSLDAPKLAAFRELIIGLVVEQPGRKVVVFSQWRRMLRLAAWAVREPLREAGLELRFFTGAEGTKRRTQNLVDFHDDPSIGALFLTDAGGVGLNLQRAASAVINLDLPWNPAVLEQRIGRIHRLGQTDPVAVYNLVGTGSIEERIASLVDDKRALFDGLFEGTEDTVRFERDGSFLAGVRKLVEEEPKRPSSLAGLPDDEDPEASAACEDELEQLLGSADESLDEGEPASRGSTVREDTSRPAPGDVDLDVARLLQSLEIQPRDGGGLQIGAPPEAADALISLFRGLAESLERGRVG